jgi:hypothetical protein
MDVISDTWLALFFLENSDLIKRFSKVQNDYLDEFPDEVYFIAYDKSLDPYKVHDALNDLTFKLIPHVGKSVLTHKLLTNAIIKAIDWKGKTIPLKVNYEITN